MRREEKGAGQRTRRRGRVDVCASFGFRGRCPGRADSCSHPSGATRTSVGAYRRERVRPTKHASAPSWVKHLRSQIAAWRQSSRCAGALLTLGIDTNFESAYTIVSDHRPGLRQLTGQVKVGRTKARTVPRVAPLHVRVCKQGEVCTLARLRRLDFPDLRAFTVC